MGFIARQSIRTKAPLAAVVLMLIVVGTLTTASLVVLKRTLHDHAANRLVTLSDQLGESFKASIAGSRARQLALAKDPAIAAYLADPTPAARDRALASLTPAGAQPELTLLVEVRKRDGSVVLSRPGTTDGKALLGAAYDQNWADLVSGTAGATERTFLGKFQQQNDVSFYPVIAALPNSDDAFVVTWRRVGNTPQTRAQLARILGSEAALNFGNADDTAWNQSGTPVHAPAPSQPGQVFDFSRDGAGRMVAVRDLIEGTPWAYAIEFPLRVVEAPARDFVWTMSKIAFVCLVAGALLAWVMSLRLTRPIETLTAAADRIAHGDTSSRVDLKREDQLGRLGESFNTMAAQVEAARLQLEEAVRKRTGELRAAKESLARREKIALIGHLASGVGHEIRNPLGVMANAVFFLESIQQDASPQVKQYLGILRQQIQLSAKIVNDLLELSRTTPATRERIGVDRLLDDRLKRIVDRAEVEADIPADLPSVVVDPVHAGQVLDNLFSNAIQAMNGSGGKVSVRARATGDGYVRLEVSDTGPGISSENYPKVFEPLFTTKARGIGLGLALSKSLAQANGGDLALVSQPGESATFAFMLPTTDGLS